MKTRTLVLGLVLVSVAQWAVPAFLIHRGQTTLREGAQYRFRTAPVDPADPFRGRYVRLDFEAARIVAQGAASAFEPGQRVYASLGRDAQGDAVIAGISATPPSSGDYLQAEVQWNNRDELRLRLPFDRYYLDERLAPEAERRYWASRPRRGAEEEDARRPAYVTVRVRKGYAVLEELYLDGQPVHERLGRFR
ncbi:GDYXXLXY domain-containing protein [Fontimonas sp. SYSU GA230001]|uniref:GDYXXLXY domain-containing protein n=1 Tax=Fontimonas sp. SYSU GA230001 TaxID=3142450 RepID=UPI0032B3FE20